MKLFKNDWYKHFFLLILVLLSLFPIYFMLINSFKNPLEYAQSSLALPSSLNWNNYQNAWNILVIPIWNTFKVVGVSLVGILLLASLCAYAFALMEFPGRQVLFALIFMLLLVPGFLTLIPLYLQIKSFGISGSIWGVVLPYIAGGQAFAILVLKTFFERIPRELLEAARIDGAGDLWIFLRVILPLSLPVLVSVGIITLIPLWNDILLPQLVLDKENRTVALALLSFRGNIQGGSVTDFGSIMAGFVVASLPLVGVFSFLMRYYIEGILSGSVKG